MGAELNAYSMSGIPLLLLTPCHSDQTKRGREKMHL